MLNYKVLFVSFLVLSLITFFLLFIIEEQRASNNSISLNLEEEIVVDGVVDIVSNNLNGIISDLIFVRDTIELSMDDEEYENSEAMIYNFVSVKKTYDQIRYITYEGDEVVRVDYNAGDVEIREQDKMQNKSDRYYVKDTIDLDYGNIYISKLDLNIENGNIEEPYKPMIRFVTPLANKRGIIVINYLASKILNDIDRYNRGSKGQLYLLSEEDYYLYSNDQHETFSFMFNEVGERFSDDYKDEWNSFTQKGQITTQNGLFTFNEFVYTYGDEFSVMQDESKWWIVSHIPVSSEYYNEISINKIKILINLIKKNIALLGLILLISIIISYLRNRNEEYLERLKYQSDYDGMTAVLNRRSGLEKIDVMLKNHEEFSLIFMDLDGLKQVNDQYGHQNGDLLIQNFVKLINSSIRAYDIFARVGGDEFILVVRNIEDNINESIYQRILEETERINDFETLPFKISFSYGVVKVGSDNIEKVDDLIKIADERMYQEKKKKKMEAQGIK